MRMCRHAAETILCHMAASRILVGYDGSPHADDALALARLLAGCTGAEIVIAQVVPWEPLSLTAVPMPELKADLERRERQALEELQEVADRPGVRAEAGPGSSPAQGLSELAEELNPELVVVGSSHRGRLGQVLAGNVALTLLDGLDRPLAVAPAGYSEGAEPLHAIGVAFDGTPESHEALTAAARLAQAAGAKIEVIRVMPLGAGLPLSPWVFTWDAGAIREDLEARERDDLEAAVRSLPREVAGSSRFETGIPAEVLAEASRDLDLLAVGSRGYGPTRRLLLGSVSAQLVREAHCPVLVTPRPSSTDRARPRVEAAQA
jgi:nucleotide-binding universal stress UspA family protein